MNDQSQMMMNLNQMSQPQMMNQVQIIGQSQPQMLSHNQGMNQQAQPQMKTAQIMMNQSQPPMMNRGYKVWSQQPPLDPSMKFQNPMKQNYRSNWKGKKVTDKRKDPRRMEKPNPSGIATLSVPNTGVVGYQPPTLNELQSQNRLKARKFYPKKKFNNRFAPYAPRNTTSFIIRAKKSGGIASLVSPCPVTPAVLPTPILSPSREVLGDMAKEEWGVDGYGSMKGLIRLRSPGNEADVHDYEEEDDGGSSESDVEEHVEVERRLDHDLSRFEMIYPNYGVDYNNVLENRVDDQDSHIAQLEEENLTLKERLFLMERELGDLRRRLMYLERQNQAVEDVNEEVVENGSENESEGGSDVPVMGIENNVVMVDSVMDSVRDRSIEANAKLDNDGVSEAEGVDNVFMEGSVPNEAIAGKDGIRGNELGNDCVFDDVREKDELQGEGVTQQCSADKIFAKENNVMDNKESGDFEMLDRNDESTSQGATDENKKDLVLNEKDESKSQVVGTSSETSRDDNLPVSC
ncbi:uncharacterized protein LOC114189509 [Vigna unguiculata]|uniref:PRLI-interacting factor A n=1 Tax=Vigna unguiculata TaxID=3917 RepID=A0A4D6MXB4_VIGUN|nr:uncharacterized protein LOC114189509 [Vigna unguiculata]XP_027933893.1 uncharacterized protein LOC114189509 [Vigna unguiculata]QCE05708.1 hypothetical protein DEO72_LG9g713 [Vigna unguiculata]